MGMDPKAETWYTCVLVERIVIRRLSMVHVPVVGVVFIMIDLWIVFEE